MAPTPVPCSVDGCPYITPQNIPSWELLLKSLEIHAQSCHATQPAGNGLNNKKLERLSRPTFSLNMTEGDWAYVLMQWNEYIGQSPVSPAEQLKQLKGACSDELLRRVYDSGNFDTINSTEALLTKMKSLAVKVVHKTRHGVLFFCGLLRFILCMPARNKYI